MIFLLDFFSLILVTPTLSISEIKFTSSPKQIG